MDNTASSKKNILYVTLPGSRMGQIGFSADPAGFGVLLLVPMLSFELMSGISLNLHGYIVGTNLEANLIFVTLTLFLRSQEDLNM